MDRFMHASDKRMVSEFGMDIFELLYNFCIKRQLIGLRYLQTIFAVGKSYCFLNRLHAFENPKLKVGHMQP